jgi:hypothetical protein
VVDVAGDCRGFLAARPCIGNDCRRSAAEGSFLIDAAPSPAKRYRKSTGSSLIEVLGDARFTSGVDSGGAFTRNHTDVVAITIDALADARMTSIASRKGAGKPSPSPATAPPKLIAATAAMAQNGRLNLSLAHIEFGRIVRRDDSIDAGNVNRPMLTPARNLAAGVDKAILASPGRV